VGDLKIVMVGVGQETSVWVDVKRCVIIMIIFKHSIKNPSSEDPQQKLLPIGARQGPFEKGIRGEVHSIKSITILEGTIIIPCSN